MVDKSYEILTELLNAISDEKNINKNIMQWASPVISFGDVQKCEVATLGVNPSNKEFVDNNDVELNGINRRFHTLNSLRLKKWSDANMQQMTSMIECYQLYFSKNPYDAWFKRLDNIISGTGISYYFPSSKACHLDLIPYATSIKWGNIPPAQQTSLLNTGGDCLGVIIKNSPIKVLILNGKTVVANLERISKTVFKKESIDNWSLPRKSNIAVSGYAYKGEIDKIGNVELNKTLYILGFNHNIQSSYGVTVQVQNAIKSWISENLKNIL